jgi:predicted CoA-binding protein
MSSSADIETLLKMHVVAVVGCSPNPARPSHQVASYLIDIGYRVIPVHPGHDEILGEKCYASLADVPEPVDVVDVFRRAEFVPEIVRQAVAIKAKGLWLQDGIDAPEAVETARKSGLTVVVNDCLMRQHLSRMGR